MERSNPSARNQTFWNWREEVPPDLQISFGDTPCILRIKALDNMYDTILYSAAIQPAYNNPAGTALLSTEVWLNCDVVPENRKKHIVRGCLKALQTVMRRKLAMTRDQLRDLEIYDIPYRL